MDESVIADLEAIGAPDQVIDQARAQASSGNDDYHVWAENMPTLDLFCDLATSWDWSMRGERIGIRATEIDVAMRFLGVRKKKVRARMYGDIRLMERAALEALREGRE